METLYGTTSRKYNGIILIRFVTIVNRAQDQQTTMRLWCTKTNLMISIVCILAYMSLIFCIDDTASRFIEELDLTTNDELMVVQDDSSAKNIIHNCETEETTINLTVSQRLLTRIQELHMLDETGSHEARTVRVIIDSGASISYVHSLEEMVHHFPSNERNNAIGISN